MERYSRHTVLPEIGEKGQRLLGDSRVMILGLGGLGSVMAEVLTRAGVGHLLVVDRDVVELSNLQRQALYHQGDLGRAKAEVVEERLREIDPGVDVDARVMDAGPGNIMDLITDMDMVLDATDNMMTRFVINDGCVRNGTPWVYTAILGTYGMTMNVLPGKGPCLRCLLEDIPGSMETCASAGVLFSLPRVMANIASTEAVKYLVGADMRDTLLTVDIWKNDYEQIKVGPREDCPCCGEGRFEYLESSPPLTTSLCGEDAIQITPERVTEIDVSEYAERYDGKVWGSSMVRFQVQGYELVLFRDGRLIVRGTKEPKRALGIYHEYIGG